MAELQGTLPMTSIVAVVVVVFEMSLFCLNDEKSDDSGSDDGPNQTIYCYPNTTKPPKSKESNLLG
jgi:hypothetical protein